MSRIPQATLPFLRSAEVEIANRFLENGYIVAPVDDLEALAKLRSVVADAAARQLGLPPQTATGELLDNIHQHVGVDRLNALRLAVIHALNAEEWVRPAYFRLARSLIETVAGNELAMQRRINLSVQLPNDDSSLLPIHADTWSGDAPFEIVVWVPLVDCYATKTMYFIPPAATKRLHSVFADYESRGAEALYQAAGEDAIFLQVPYGNVLLFNQTCAHGNRINREPTTRWSLNCRFKGVFTPYADKRLGEFFEPITLRPASRIGLDYALPGGFNADA